MRRCHRIIRSAFGVAGALLFVTLLAPGIEAQTTTVTFDNPVPPGASGSLLNGVFQGIDFGTGRWRWEGAYAADATNNVYFDSPTGASRTFTFSPAPRVLNSVRVFTTNAGTLTLSDDLGQVRTQAITVGTMQLVSTGWTQASTTVTVNFTTGWNVGLDDIVYTSAGPSDSTPPTVSMTGPADGATVSNTITVSATASDNLGVAGVQFLLDGAPLGAEDPSTPYAISWDTTTAANGLHTLSARARDAANNTATATSITVNVANSGPPGSDVTGQWSSPVTLPVVAVHMMLLRSGQVLMWDRTAGDARLWNPALGVFTAVPNNFTDMFCAGQVTLADGRPLVVGGNQAGFVGLRDANVFNPTTQAWDAVAPMAFPRWYPTATTLSDGRVLVVSGTTTCSTCLADTPEIYDPVRNTWTPLNAARLTMPLYPFIFVLPDGRVLYAGSDEANTATYVLDLATQSWTVVDPVVVDGGSAAMYRPGVVLKAGTPGNVDVAPYPGVPSAYVLDTNQPSPRWRQVGSMAFPRVYHTLTLLPDGNVIVTGGVQNSDEVSAPAVLAAEIWNAQTETWATMASGQARRAYHSTALLLPDARVLVAGSGRFDPMTDEFRAEIFSPPYLFRGPRPTITSAPSAVGFGSQFFVETPDAASISSVALLRLGAVTHGIDQDQRYVPLTFGRAGNGLNVQAPANGAMAPAGYYMLFLVNATGVPSVAAFVRVGISDVNPPSVAVTAPANGAIVGGTITVSANASDDVGVVGVQFLLNGAALGAEVASAPYAISWDTTGSANGNYTLAATARDAAGNVTTSAPVGVTVSNNRVPTTTAINPSSAAAGGPAFTLTVNGTNFVTGSVVRWNGANRTTTFVSATQVTAAIPASDIATAGTAQVTVFNPTPGGGTSNAQTFTITSAPNPLPTTTSINPTSAAVGGAAFTLTVNGTNFVAGSIVRWNGANRTTTFVSATQVTASIPGTDIATAGTASVTVFNPAPGGGTSNAQTFTISASASTTVTFDNPIPPGSSGSFLNGLFQGLNFGTNQWRWENASGADSTRHIYFASGAGTSRTFTFSPGPQMLVSMRVFTGVAGTLTLTDNLGQSRSQAITTGSMQLVTTGWTQASTTVTVAFTAGRNLGVDDIVYRAP